ncbi:Protein FAR1-RELATED SEQUENCE 3 [Hordeum vulgare]|nr:Protein FAR1-RELATED SEQUENCE 3 [Hordeum vulgare]
MATTISMVFLNSTHRCCKWHLFRVAITKLGKVLGKDEPFAEAFYGCINGTDTVEEFEERRVDPEDDRYMCSCNMFELCGLISQHIIRVMVHLNVQTAPASYMLERWSKRAVNIAPDPGDRHRVMHFGVPITNILKFNCHCRKFYNLASDACFSDEAYKSVSGLIEKGKAGVAAMKSRAWDGVLRDGEAQGHEANEQVHASAGPVTRQ